MAKKKSSGKVGNIFHLLLAIMGLSYFSMILMLGVQIQRGKIDRKDIKTILQVVAGSKKFALTLAQVKDYNSLMAKRAKEKEENLILKGGTETQAKARGAHTKSLQVLAEERSIQKALIDEEKRKLTEISEKIEKLIETQKKEQEKLIALKKNRLTVEQAIRTKNITSTLKGMDSGEIAKFLTSTMLEDGPHEAARILRLYIKPGVHGEIFTEMTQLEVRQILPLLEDEYADLSAADIVKRWTDSRGKDYQTPQNIAIRMSKMNVKQAIKVLMLLPKEIRAQVAQLLQL